MVPVFLIILLSLIGVIGDFFIKLSGNGSTFIAWRWFLIGVIVYSSTAIGWFFVMKHIKLSSLGIIYALSTVIFLTLAGVFYFKEKLSIYELLGLVLAVASIILLRKFA